MPSPIETLFRTQTFAGADPNILGVGWIDGDGADRLHVWPIEHWLESGAAVDGLPDAAAGGARKHGEPAILVDGGDGRDASAHCGGADVARGQS